ncbi:hypothetical protein V8C44DRAFT_89573 [Trichoderma aethiopicum]
MLVSGVKNTIAATTLERKNPTAMGPLISLTQSLLDGLLQQSHRKWGFQVICTVGNTPTTTNKVRIVAVSKAARMQHAGIPGRGGKKRSRITRRHCHAVVFPLRMHFSTSDRFCSFDCLSGTTREIIVNVIGDHIKAQANGPVQPLRRQTSDRVITVIANLSARTRQHQRKRRRELQQQNLNSTRERDEESFNSKTSTAPAQTDIGYPPHCPAADTGDKTEHLF